VSETGVSEREKNGETAASKEGEVYMRDLYAKAHAREAGIQTGIISTEMITVTIRVSIDGAVGKSQGKVESEENSGGAGAGGQQ